MKKIGVLSGWVDDIEGDKFYCRVAEGELHEDNQPEDQIEIPVEVLNVWERPYLLRGVFVSINLYDDGRIDVVFFKAAWTAKEIEEGNRSAEALRCLFADADAASPSELFA